MSLWPKPEVIPIFPPSKPLRWVWMVIFAALFIITGLFLILSWGDNHYFNSLSFWLMLILVPAIVGSVALSIRFYLYGLAQERFDIWQQEQNRVDYNWQDWAMSGTHIITSSWILPNELTATKILLDRTNLPVIIDKALEFDDDQLDYEHYFEDLFFHLASPLSSLPDHLKVVITVYSSAESFSYLDDIIYTTYRRSKIKQSHTVQHQLTPYTQIDKIIELIDNPQYDLQLLIINNLVSKGSAYFSAILMIDEQLYSEFDNPMLLESTVLRPMAHNNISVAIAQIAEMQPAILDVQQLWCANLDKQQEIEIVKQLAEHNISLESINYLDSLVGKQTDLAYWSLLSLGNQLVKQTKQTILLATSSQGDCILSVLTKNNLGVMNEE